MADERAPSTYTSAEETMQALVNHLPQVMQAYNSQIYPNEEAKYNSAQAFSGPYQQLLSQLYSQYAPQLAKTDNQIALNNANTDAQILNGPGRQLANTYGEIDRGLNPEYYATRALTGNKLSELLNSINLNAPNTEAERLVNQENVRSGNINTPSTTNTVSNAIQFGDQNRIRQNQLSSAIDKATSFMGPALNSNFNAATTVLNRPTSNGASATNFAGIAKPGEDAQTSGNNFLNQITGLRNNEMQINANRRDVFDRINEGISAV